MKYIYKIKELKLLVFLLISQAIFSQSVEGNVDNLPVHEYTLTIKKGMVNKAGKIVEGITVNGTIPGPVLEFTEGEYAVIYVKNEMTVETSVHWHGLLLPNFYDGVPYLTTPPIKPGTTFKYEFALNQSGTYWYHSHTMLQEQSGVYGSFVIKPKTPTLEYDKELVLMLSDWTNEKPHNVLRNLKRGNEWYSMKKGTSTPLNKVIRRGAFGAQLNFWRQRMEGADVADVYYPAFLINGEETIEYPEFNPGEKIRLRIIDGAASTSFWMTFGGSMPMLVSSDGLDVVSVSKNKTFIGVAETYDFIVTVPDDGKMEFRITAQDGSGQASAFIGKGKVIPAIDVTRPDKIGMMKKMAKMDMKMGAHALKFQPKKDERYKIKAEYGMQMGDMKDMNMSENSSIKEKTDHSKMNHSAMNMTKSVSKNKSSMQMKDATVKDSDIKMGEMAMFSEYNYDYLKSLKKTNYDKSLPVNEILLNLTGNMNRYIWSMNGVPLSEADNIKIKGGAVTRITFNNL